jgi:hypothetical protein
MGHISQAWTNLAPPSANCVTDCAMESRGACGDGDYGLSPAAMAFPDFDDRFNS